MVHGQYHKEPSIFFWWVLRTILGLNLGQGAFHLPEDPMPACQSTFHNLEGTSFLSLLLLLSHLKWVNTKCRFLMQRKDLCLGPSAIFGSLHLAYQPHDRCLKLWKGLNIPFSCTYMLLMNVPVHSNGFVTVSNHSSFFCSWVVFTLFSLGLDFLFFQAWWLFCVMLSDMKYLIALLLLLAGHLSSLLFPGWLHKRLPFPKF